MDGGSEGVASLSLSATVKRLDGEAEGSRTRPRPRTSKGLMDRTLPLQGRASTARDLSGTAKSKSGS